MKTKNIPFDAKMAKDIQDGKIEGKIVEVTTKKFTYNSHGCIAIDQKVDKFIELPEEAPKHGFKPFDKVLVRMCDEEVWRISLYGFKRENGTHSCINTSCWEQCIPYEGNEYLVGTTEKPKEE